MRKGQTLVLTSVVLLIVLSLGIAAASRYIKSLHTFVKSDHATRALAVAEAAIERLLDMDNSVLSDYITNGTCGDDCVLTFADGSEATVTLSFLGDSQDTYEIAVSTKETSSVRLGGYLSGGTLDICWNNDTSIVGMYVYFDETYKVENFAVNPYGNVINNTFSDAVSKAEYTSCKEITTSNQPEMLRIRSENLETDVFIVPSSGQSIPKQGFLLESLGISGEAVRKVRVTKTFGELPSIFDFAIYQTSTEEPLSN